jgi:hypothetical protein
MDLIDSEDPKCRKSSTDIEAPMRATPQRENVEPRRDNVRNDSDDPRVKKSSTESDDPKRA